MSQIQAVSVLDRMLERLSRCLDVESASRVASLETDPEVQARVDDLAERANQGSITPDEHHEYQAYISADDLISILKVKARQFVRASDAE